MNEIPKAKANDSNYDYLKARLSSGQLKKLDALNGTEGDEEIDNDVFTIAKSMIDRNELTGNVLQNSALVQQVSDIMRGINMDGINEEFNSTPMTGVNPNTLRQGLNLTSEQTEKLLALSQELTGNNNTIDRGIVSAVICIVRGQPAPKRIPESINARIQAILGGEQTSKNGNTFGIY